MNLLVFYTAIASSLNYTVTAIAALQQVYLSARAVILRAEHLSQREGVVGSIAFSRSGDLSSGTFEDAQVLKKFGEVPGDLNTL